MVHNIKDIYQEKHSQSVKVLLHNGKEHKGKLCGCRLDRQKEITQLFLFPSGQIDASDIKEIY